MAASILQDRVQRDGLQSLLTPEAQMESTGGLYSLHLELAPIVLSEDETARLLNASQP